MQKFNPQEFVHKQVMEIREVIGNERALIAVSGALTAQHVPCSHTVLLVKIRCVCEMLDDTFMRVDEPERVRQLLSQPPISRLVALQTEILRENPSFTRVFYAV